jgi:quercetin dioxygenase-like cupin family protein
MRLIVLLVVLISVTAAVLPQDSYLLAPDRVQTRTMSEIAAVEVVPGVLVRTVVGTTASLSLADFGPGSLPPAHHHEREQIDVGITGTFDVILSNRTEAVGPGEGVIIPSNISHSIANSHSSPARLVEFHTVRRLDLVPPRPRLTFPAGPEPAAVPAQRLTTRLDSPSTIVGETALVSWRNVARGAVPLAARSGRMRGELFLYVVRGEVELLTGKSSQRVAPEGLIVVPDFIEDVMIKAAVGSDAAILEFIRKG